MKALAPSIFGLVLVVAVAACIPAPEAPQPTGDEASFTTALDNPEEDVASGCSTERSCGEPTLVCKRPDEPRPCGAAGCVDMQFSCSSDGDCVEGYSCSLCTSGDPYPCPFVTGRCQPRTCTRARDCLSKNLVCQTGSCVHKPCRSSSSCKGYCVASTCWNQPGWCLDTTLPPPP
jgi:hypothetical protein